MIDFSEYNTGSIVACKTLELDQESDSCRTLIAHGIAQIDPLEIDNVKTLSISNVLDGVHPLSDFACSILESEDHLTLNWANIITGECENKAIEDQDNPTIVHSTQLLEFDGFPKTQEAAGVNPEQGSVRITLERGKEGCLKDKTSSINTQCSWYSVNVEGNIEGEINEMGDLVFEVQLEGIGARIVISKDSSDSSELVG